MTRTDTHRPAAMDPACYRYIGGFMAYGGPNYGVNGEARNLLNGEPAGVYADDDGKCDHCGSGLRYVAVLAYDGGGYIGVGYDCLENRFELTDKAAWDRKRLAAAYAAAEAEEANRVYREQFAADHPDVHAMLVAAREHGHRLDIVTDCAARFHGSRPQLSDKQIAALGKIAAKEAEFAARDAERAAERANAKARPTGKGVKVEGVVEKVDCRENAYGVRYVLTVRNAQGWRVWGTMPRALSGVEEGELVRFVADVEGVDGDHAFGFFVRPRKAEFVSDPREATVYNCVGCGADLKEAGVVHGDRCPDCDGLPF